MKVQTVNIENCFAQSCLPPRLGIYLLQVQVLRDWEMNQRQGADECWKKEWKSEVEMYRVEILACPLYIRLKRWGSGKPFFGRECRRSLISLKTNRVQGSRVSWDPRRLNLKKRSVTKHPVSPQSQKFTEANIKDERSGQGIRASNRNMLLNREKWLASIVYYLQLQVGKRRER